LEVKLRSFQLKLNCRAIVTNVQLHGFGLVNSNFCTFCELCAETTLHLFCLCQILYSYLTSKRKMSNWKTGEFKFDRDI